MKPLHIQAIVFWGILCTFLVTAIPLHAQNIAMHFDGDQDHIRVAPVNGLTNYEDFTVEMWFKTDPTACPAKFQRLFSLFSDLSLFEVGVCQNDLFLVYENANQGISSGEINISGVNQGTWHHLAVRKMHDLAEIFVDCSLVWDNVSFGNPQIPELRYDEFRVGMGLGLEPHQNFLGEIDEVRVWNYALDHTTIGSYCASCLPGPANPGLVLYWQFEEGLAGMVPVQPIAGNDNTVITDVSDSSPFGNHGHLNGFELTGLTSNFVASALTLPVSFQHHSIFISNTSVGGSLTTEICSGTPLHFRLIDQAGATIQPVAGMAIDWYYSDDGTSWTHIVPSNAMFATYAFVSLPGHPALSVTNCQNHPTGFVSRVFQARIHIDVMGVPCEYVSNAAPLRIYCPVSGLAMTLDPPHQSVLCEDDVVQFSASLAYGLPAPNPAVNYIQTSWTINIPPAAPAPLNYAANELSMQYPQGGGATHQPGTIAFTATVSNGVCPAATVTQYVVVDAKPVCGDIVGVGNHLIADPGGDSNLFYICSGNDAAIAINLPFSNCNPQWKYMFPHASPGVWQSLLGANNSLQNTNVLQPQGPPGSPYLWPAGEKCIVYRVECYPYSYPNSGCDPCFSNEVRICLHEVPAVPVIIHATNPICAGNHMLLEVDNPVAGIDYHWYHLGLAVGTGSTFQASQPGCYTVSAGNVCATVMSDPFCLDVCTVVATISCPLPECPCVGDVITVSATQSFSTCGGALTYSWSISGGTLIADHGSYIEHIPDAAGTTYIVTVTDAHGCVGIAQTTIVPCGDGQAFVCGTSTVSDANGNVYNTVQIGNQCWMRENLNVGMTIPLAQEMQDNGLVEKYCYDDDPYYCQIYGGLYQWDEMMQYSEVPGSQGICPPGWHVPTDDDWNVLEQTVDPSVVALSTGWRGTDAGIRLKEAGHAHWEVGSDVGTNVSGFTALPGGQRNCGGSFVLQGSLGRWWTSSKDSPQIPWYHSMHAHLPYAERDALFVKGLGFSVRCIKD